MTSHPLFDADTDAPLLRLGSPQDLIRAVPYLLGFHPRDSLVLVGLSGGANGQPKSRVRVVARLDLRDLGDQNDPNSGIDAAASAIRALSRAGSSSVVALFCTDFLEQATSWLPLLSSLGARCEEVGLTVASWIFAGTDEWALATREDDDLVFAGPFQHDEASVIPAAATYAGMVARPDRAALGEVLHADPARARSRLTSGLDLRRGTRRDCSAAVAGRSRRSDIRAIFAATRVVTPIDDSRAIRFGSALGDMEVRDACWLAIDCGRIDGDDLWAQLARALPDEYRAPPLFLFGWLQWRAGRGALASLAVEEALRCDPFYSAADLLAGALTQGLDPFRTPRMRKGG